MKLGPVYIGRCDYGMAWSITVRLHPIFWSKQYRERMRVWLSLCWQNKRILKGKP